MLLYLLRVLLRTGSVASPLARHPSFSFSSSGEWAQDGAALAAIAMRRGSKVASTGHAAGSPFTHGVSALGTKRRLPASTLTLFTLTKIRQAVRTLGRLSRSIDFVQRKYGPEGLVAAPLQRYVVRAPTGQVSHARKTR